MNVYYCKEAKGMFLGAFGIVVANSQEQASRLLMIELGKARLAQEITPDQMILIDQSSVHVSYLNNGDY